MTVPCLWGRGDEVIWAEGESLILVGPTGVGKTTLTGQIVRARLGLIAVVLGYPVEPTSERVLYLAMDRPAQIARSLHRHFHEAERAVLTERVRVWKGPPPTDLARHPETLVGLAHMATADTVILDSLKDAALGLTEDEVAAYNRARQLALTEGVQLVELHHVVKRGPSGAKPTTIADVYGSTWLTAGAGSVVLLWGAAGDPIVEWHHLKQPAGEVGPMQVVHDHVDGRTDVWKGTDLVTIAVASGTHGLTVRAAAGASFNTDKPTPAQIAKAQRRLSKLVGDGHLVPREAGSTPTGGKPEKVYHATAHHDRGSNHGAITRPPAEKGNHGTDEQSRDDASSQVRAITPAITAITEQEQSRTAPSLKRGRAVARHRSHRTRVHRLRLAARFRRPRGSLRGISVSAGSMLPDRPPPRVRHGWRCLARGPYRDEAREMPNGTALVVTVCKSCDGTDLEHRLRVEREGAT